MYAFRPSFLLEPVILAKYFRLTNKIQNITNIENQTFNIEFSMIRSNYLKKTEQDFVLTSGQN